jgi:hypothetical protein
MNKKALILAAVMMSLSYASNFIFPGPGGPDSSIFYFFGIALLGFFTYLIVVRFFPGKAQQPNNQSKDPMAPEPNNQSKEQPIVEPKAKPNPKKFRIIFYAIIGLLVVSVLLNVILLKERHLPYVGSVIVDGVTWHTENRMVFSGLAIETPKPIKDYSKLGYTWYQGEIKINYLKNGLLECRISNVTAFREIVSVDSPFQTEERLCKIIEFDGQAKKARLEANGITFSINGDSVMWQTKTEAGVLVSIYKHVSEINSPF